MKIVLTTCLGILLCCIGLQAQNNFQFSRVWNFGAGTNYTVPAGKVLKIESVNFNSPTLNTTYSSCYINCPGCGSSSGVSCTYDVPPVFAIDQNIYSSVDNFLYVGSGGSCSVCPTTRQVSFNASGINIAVPIWLGEGKNLKINGNGVFISALEFNLVP